MASKKRGRKVDVVANRKQWAIFVDREFDPASKPGDFLKRAWLQQKKWPLPGIRIAQAILEPKPYAASNRVFSVTADFLDQLLVAGAISIPDILAALLYESDLRTVNLDDGIEADAKKLRIRSLYVDYEILNRLAERIAQGYKLQSSAEARRTIFMLIKWLNAALSYNTTEALTYNPAWEWMGRRDPYVKYRKQAVACSNHGKWPYVRDSLGRLLLAIFGQSELAKFLTKSDHEDLKAQFMELAASFVPLVSRWSEQLTGQFELIQSQQAPTENSQRHKILGIDRVHLDTLIPFPPLTSPRSRVGLYVYISALLVGRPLTEDSAVLAHLQSRYKEDVESLTTDLIVASFDVLANAIVRKESRDSLFSLKSFLVNKVPHLISLLTSSFFLPLTPEFCIEQALKFVDSNIFPSLTSSFNNVLGNDNIVGDVRQDFLLACVLHSLVLEESIPRIYGEVPMSGLPAGGRLFRENLVTQCQSNPQRLEELINEIENMDGNAGAVVGAVTDVIRNMCATKDTMSLKSVCSSLSRKPLALDVIMQYASPVSILQPLCQLLNEWKYEEDQGEHQPVYEDFAGILLLTLAMVNRYDLTKADLGVGNDQSFVSQLLDTGLQSRSQKDLSEDDSKRLSNWIRGLYETQGITEEVMSTCRPQDFYLLVSTLFDQSVLACSQDVIKLETIKTGLEMLLEPWFIPSLCIALRWLANEISRPGTNKAILIQILHKLMRPSSLSGDSPGDAQGMHSAILLMVADLLEESLRDLQAKEPSRYDIEPLLDDLKSHSQYKRSGGSSLSELQAWTHTAGGGLQQSIRHTFQSLVTWGNNLPMVVQSPNYTHRQVISAVRMIGSTPTLRVILEEVRQQMEHGNGVLALDIATEMICAPTTDFPSEAMDAALMLPATHPRPASSGVSLRDRLKLVMEETPKKDAVDSIMAETVVRLHRNVEFIMLQAAQAQALPTDLGAQEIMHAVELTDAVDSAAADAAAVEAAGAAIVPEQSLDLNVAAGMDIDAAAAGVTMDLDLGNAAAGMGDQSVDEMLQGSGLGSTEDDIFGDLMDADDNFNFDEFGM